MRITHVEVKPDDSAVEHIRAGGSLDDKHGILAYCIVCFDDVFVVREVRVIGSVGGIRVIMPDRKLAFRFSCGHKNYFDSYYCCKCGQRRATSDNPDPTSRKHPDVCHPIDGGFRRHLDESVIAAVRARLLENNDAQSVSS